MKFKQNEFATPEGKQWLRGLLQSENVTVTFVKKDGTERVMKCTLKDIPADKMPKGTNKKGSEEAIAVYDLDSDGWRSFRFDSVKQIKFELSAV